MEAATTVYREACDASGNEARAATGQDDAAPEVEIFRTEDCKNVPRRIGDDDLGWTVIADIGTRKLINMPDAWFVSRQSIVWSARNLGTGYLPLIGLSQWAGIENITDPEGLERLEYKLNI